MPEAQCVKYPIKPGQCEGLISWVAGLKDRSGEMAEVMTQVGFIAEAVFVERSDDGDYILVYTSAIDLAAVNEALSSSKLPLVREFDQLMVEAVDVEKAVVLESVYHTP